MISRGYNSKIKTFRKQINWVNSSLDNQANILAISSKGFETSVFNIF